MASTIIKMMTMTTNMMMMKMKMTIMMPMTKSYLEVAQLVKTLQGLITKFTFITWFEPNHSLLIMTNIIA